MGSFELLTSFDVEYAPSSIKKWRSKRTGLQAAIVAKETPLVQGYFAVATEVADDSGTPHTLEHLIFMGSKKYPYKGLLDTLGNVMFSDTNAWTATDRTVYTLNSVGWEGFKTLLPVYLDHVLHPTLTDEACYTEVFHVDGEGNERGVVFSEMQGIQDQPWFYTMLELQRSMYVEKSGYSSETGGLLASLRGLSNDTIRKFHKESYRPSNLCVVVSGSVDEDEFLQVMEEFDKELPDFVQHKRPFVDSEAQIKRLEKTVVKEIEFPESDESFGEVAVSWVGPKHEQYMDDLAITMLLEYFCESPISLLNKNLVEIEEPYASELEHGTDDFTHIIPYIKMNDVPTERLHETKDKLFDLIKEHCTIENFDVKRMREVLENSKQKVILQCEKSSDMLSDQLIDDFMYNDLEGKALTKNVRSLADYETLIGWDVEKWVEFTKEYIIENPCVIVISKPSEELFDKLEEEKEEMEKARLEKLGDKGLQELKEKLAAAQKKNDAPIPDEIIKSFPKPSPANIKFIKTKTIGVGLNKDVTNDLEDEVTKKILEDTPENFPLYLNIDQFQSEFINIDILLSSFEIPERLLPYFEILTELFSMPLVIDGKTIPMSEVVKELENDTVMAQLRYGLSSEFTELIHAQIQVKKGNYPKAIDWFKKAFWYSKFDESRVKTIVEKTLASLPSMKRSGVGVLNSLHSTKCLSTRSLKLGSDQIAHEQFFRDLSTKLADGGYAEIEADLEELRSSLFKPSNFRILIAGDVSSLEHPVQAWNVLLAGRPTSMELIPVPLSNKVLSPLGQKLENQAFIATGAAITSTYLLASTNISTDFLDEDAPAMALACSYLQAVEGPFWRGIRGTGLAYGANLSRNVETGQLSFEVYRGADGIKSFEVAKKIVTDLAEGKVELDETLYAGAVSAFVTFIAKGNYFHAASSKFVDDVLKKRGPDYATKVLKAVAKLTPADIVRVLKKYFVPMFKSDTSAVFVCAPPSAKDDLVAFFTKNGYEVSVEEVSRGDNDDEDDSDEYDSEEYETETDESE